MHSKFRSFAHVVFQPETCCLSLSLRLPARNDSSKSGGARRESKNTQRLKAPAKCQSHVTRCKERIDTLGRQQVFMMGCPHESAQLCFCPSSMKLITPARLQRSRDSSRQPTVRHDHAYLFQKPAPATRWFFLLACCVLRLPPASYDLGGRP